VRRARPARPLLPLIVGAFEIRRALMTTTIVTPDQDTIVAEIQIAAPPERVFKAISDADQLQR